jgi:hypothetical protein
VASDQGLHYQAAKALFAKSYHADMLWYADPESAHVGEDALTDINTAFQHLQNVRGRSTRHLYSLLCSQHAFNQAVAATQEHGKQPAFASVRRLEKQPPLSLDDIDPFLPVTDSDWGMTGQAEALIQLGETTEALDILPLLKGKKGKGRDIFSKYLESSAYAKAGHIDVGMDMAVNSLKDVVKLGGGRHLQRLEQLYRGVRSQQKYRSSSSVLRLGAHLEYASSQLA